MSSIKVNDQYINLKTGISVQVVSIDENAAVEVATVTVTGRLINHRNFKASSLRNSAHTAKGALRTSGYVAVHTLPAGHPLAPAPMPERPVAAPLNLFAKVYLDTLDDSELFERGRALRAEVALVEAKLKDVKTELKKRRPQARSYILGNAYLNITPNVRFDPKKALNTLTPQEYDQICLPKPDPERAREVLSERRYAEVCTDHGNKVEIRTATDEDRLALSETETDPIQSELDATEGGIEDPFLAA